MDADQQSFYNLFAALAIGLLIGVERGWHGRGVAEGERVAGIRSFGLIGLLGGVTAALARHFGPLALGLSYLGFALLLTGVYMANVGRTRDVGITTLIAALLTFGFGALAGAGDPAAASAFAVLAALLLSSKPLLHRWLEVLEWTELRAGLQLLLISVVMLPVLPDRGYGPWQALNPYQIWWMVVLVAAISFAGYCAIRIGGARKGAVFTGLFGGLASSTALTLHFSRLARSDAAFAPVLATGVLIACGTMFLRMLLVASLLNIQLFRWLLPPAALMAALIYVPALIYWVRTARQPTPMAAGLKNPLELRSALLFGLFLALIMLLGKALRLGFGDAGIFALAAASGVADVDAITLSLAGMSRDGLAPKIACAGIVIAAVINSLIKGAMALSLGGRPMGLRVGLPLVVSVLGGLLVAWLMYR